MLRICLSPGDLARVEENVTSNGAAGKKFTKSKKNLEKDEGDAGSVEGVVYKVTA